MTATYAALIGTGLLVTFLLLGFPIFCVFFIINIIGITWLFGIHASGMFSNSLLSTLVSEPLITIPLYFFMGELLFHTGAMERLTVGLDRLIARTRSRMYILAVGASTAMGTVSGSALADAALLGRTLYPSIVSRGYNPKLTAGLVMAGSTLAPIIPPSIFAVIIATLAKESVADLLIAGILPGLFLAVLFLAYILVRVWLDPTLAPPLETASTTQKISLLRAISLLMPITIVFIVVIGGMLLGIATPTESAALGALVALLAAIPFRAVDRKTLYLSALGTARTTSMIFLIVMSANLFGQLIAYTGLPAVIVSFVASFQVSGVAVLIGLLAVAFVLCQVLGQIEFMLVSIPIYTPLIQALAFDPIWFWMLYLIVITVAAMTPPFGVTIFVFQGAAETISLKDTYDATWPFVAIILLGVAIMIAFPGIITFLPQLLK